MMRKTRGWDFAFIIAGKNRMCLFFFLSEAHISLKCEQCTLTVVFF